MNKQKSSLLLFILFIGSVLTAQNPLHVVLGTNNVPITEVEFVHEGALTTQTNGETSNNTSTDSEVLLNYIEINDNTKLYLNDFGNVLRNNNFNAQTSGVGVFREGALIETDDMTGFEIAAEDAFNNVDLLNFLYYDGSTNVPDAEDFDIFFAKGIINGDYVSVGERNGNTDFSLTALDEDGNVIANSVTLLFGETDGTASGNGSTKYDWDIGYSPTTHTDQSMIFSVVEANLFNIGSETIYGFRIDNNGNADVKFFGLSPDGFAGNPTNPKIGGLAGNVFNDANGLVDNTVDGSPIPTPGGVQLYANLYDNTTNEVIASVPINADGSYEFLDLEPGTNYSVSISTNQGIAGTALPAQNLPTNWIYTGDNIGTGAGDDGSPNGTQTSITVAEELVPNVNFGIEQIPTADPYSFAISSPSPNSTLVIGDLNTSDLSGSDPEDGQMGTSSSFGIASLPANGNDLIYNGIVITLGQDGINPPSPSNPFVIENYNPSLFEIEFNGDPNQENTSFDYVSIDEAGQASIPVTYALVYPALPVEWLSFSVRKSSNVAIIEFSTATEISNSHFMIQKSNDGINYDNISRIEGAINSLSISKYNYSDRAINKGINYYRIMQVDLNGESSYSTVRNISGGEIEEDIVVFPNPVGSHGNTLNIKNSLSKENLNVKIYNCFGMEVKSINILDAGSSNNFSFEVADLVSGTYVVKIEGYSEPAIFTVVR
ncbi:T9SS type A sorting domain-containing protein [Saprospiraceae bacterium]|nr:T9SS type A sorting domain-containing protein [Saprospiraceae bacterium]